MDRISSFIAKRQSGVQRLNAEYHGVYGASIHQEESFTLFAARDSAGRDHICTYGREAPLLGTPVRSGGAVYVDCPLSQENAATLRRLYPFCAPIPVLSSRRCTFGVGDRLARATPAHIRVFKKYDVTPVFAQQSLRELSLTGRTFRSLLDDVTFFVFREGYTHGYGADGDHLKHEEDIREALECGCTMITLDLSEHIRPLGAEIPREPDEALREFYCGGEHTLKDGQSLRFTPEDLRRAYAVYGEALDFTAEIYRRLLADSQAELEISIDETAVPTTPLEHFFVASELVRRGVRFATIAPRFTGEFQKGIDYVGDLQQFKEDMYVHQAIADTFGYKLSIHSGSDKFSVFPIIGEVTSGRFHLKTSGTNWLEAMRLVAIVKPSLYRNIHRYAAAVFHKAKAYYHVTADLQAVPDIDLLTDEELPLLFDADDSRQLIHITYGFILSHPIYGLELRKLWTARADLYSSLVEERITRHMECLGIPYIGGKREGVPGGTDDDLFGDRLSGSPL